MFDAIGQPLGDRVLKGYNACILAYGQTGSGKTYTMTGVQKSTGSTANNSDSHSHSKGSGNTSTTPSNNSPRESIIHEIVADKGQDSKEKGSQRGLIPRTLEYLFDCIDRLGTEDPVSSYSCQCSFLEIYNNRITDLLSDVNFADASSTINNSNYTGFGSYGSNNSSKSDGLQIRHHPSKGVYVENLSQHTVASPADAQKLLTIGTKRRRVGFTKMNSESSRSHIVFKLTITQKGVNSSMISSLSLVDLAGSECQRTAGTSKSCTVHPFCSIPIAPI